MTFQCAIKFSNAVGNGFSGVSLNTTVALCFLQGAQSNEADGDKSRKKIMVVCGNGFFMTRKRCSALMVICIMTLRTSVLGTAISEEKTPKQIKS